MTTDQLRKALSELNAKRDAAFYFNRAEMCLIPNAMLLPDEADHLVKLTDGRSEYVIDADRVAWVRLSAESHSLTTH